MEGWMDGWMVGANGKREGIFMRLLYILPLA
jgi:hypothetical protein